MLKPNYETLKRIMTNALSDLSIIAGDRVNDNGASWKDVAGTAACNLRVLANLLDDARRGDGGPFQVFPSPAECLESDDDE